MRLIPFSPLPDQTFKTTVDGETVRIRIFWNATGEAWYMDLEGVSFDLTVRGLRMCTNIYMLEGLAIREIGDFMVVDLESKEADPTFEGFGDRWQLMYASKEELGYDIV